MPMSQLWRTHGRNLKIGLEFCTAEFAIYQCSAMIFNFVKLHDSTTVSESFLWFWGFWAVCIQTSRQKLCQLFLVSSLGWDLTPADSTKARSSQLAPIYWMICRIRLRAEQQKLKFNRFYPWEEEVTILISKVHSDQWSGKIVLSSWWLSTVIILSLIHISEPTRPY